MVTRVTSWSYILVLRSAEGLAMERLRRVERHVKAAIGIFLDLVDIITIFTLPCSELSGLGEVPETWIRNVP